MNKRRLKSFVRLLLEQQAADDSYFEENYAIIEDASKHVHQLHSYFNDEMPIYKETMKEKLKQKIKQLSKNKIKDVLGCGMYKCAYLLDNDHVLAIGNKSLASKEYEKLAKEQQAGTGGVLDVGVFDYGLVGEDLFYVEMSRIIPLEEWYAFTRNLKTSELGTEARIRHVSMLFVALRFIIFAESVEHDAAFILKNIFKIIREAAASRDRLQYHYKVVLEKATEILNPREIRAATKAILNNIARHGAFATGDVHAKNVGVDMKNPDRMIIFDID